MAVEENKMGRKRQFRKRTFLRDQGFRRSSLPIYLPGNYAVRSVFVFLFISWVVGRTLCHALRQCYAKKDTQCGRTGWKIETTAQESYFGKQ